jgi:hypothetical protein
MSFFRITGFAHLLLFSAMVQAAELPCSLVGGGPELKYIKTEKGDQICDFSYAGYGGGGVAFPTSSNKKTVSVTSGEASDAIQSAINQVASMPLVEGVRGVVELSTGTYNCSKTIAIKTSGIILRGVAGGTVMKLTGKPHIGIEIAHEVTTGDGKDSKKKAKAESGGEGKAKGLGKPLKIADQYVPSGTRVLTLEQMTGVKVGDTIEISRDATKGWIHFMGMDNLMDGGKLETWMKEDRAITCLRVVKAIKGKEITLDVPLTDAIDSRFLEKSPATVTEVEAPKRITKCGIEGIRIDAPAPVGDWRDPQFIGVIINNSQDIWLKNVGMKNTFPDIQVGEDSARVTIDSMKSEHPGEIKQSEKSNGYASYVRLLGSQILMNRCSLSGDNAFYISTSNTTSTLNVVLNSLFQGNGSIQPHMTWSTGLLLDGCKLNQGEIIIRNRGKAGSGHGWTMGWSVVWNCSAKSITVEQPPGATNWCIGSSGKYDVEEKWKSTWLFMKGSSVTPASLYLAQLRARLGDAAVKVVGN